MTDADALARGVLEGDRAAAARALSWIVDERPGFEKLWSLLYRSSGRAHKLGVCGPPGSGKSTLAGRLIAHYRSLGEKVGVLAVDPSSPFSGGAFLGDRLRIQEHATDPGVFIRSLSTRGMVGGLTPAVFGAIHVLEAFGCARILLETVGTGQDETQVARVADTTLYVLTPSLGDEIQGLKAGAMETADLFVVNKCDLEGTDRALGDLRRALSLGEEAPGWSPPVLGVSALKGLGLAELAAGVEEHRAHLKSSGEGERRRKEQARELISIYLTERLVRDLRREIRDEHLERLISKRSDPVALGDELVEALRSR